MYWRFVCVCVCKMSILNSIWALSNVFFIVVDGTPGQSTCRGRRWAEEGILAPWMSWRISPDPLAPVAVGLSLQTGTMNGITPLLGTPSDTRMTDGDAAAPHLYHRRGGTRGTVIALVDCHRAKDMIMPFLTLCWRGRRGLGERTGVLPDWMRTVTLPQKAAPEESVVTIAGHLATVRKRTTLCLRTLSGRQSDTTGLTLLQTDTAL